MKRLLLTILALFIITLVFVGGVLVGNTYNVTDPLCPVTATPHILESAFISENGIVFPKGTIVPLRECAYMQRFTFRFAIDNSVDIKPYIGALDYTYGFAELQEKTE